VTVSYETRLAIVAWHKTRKELGTLKEQARKRGVSTRTAQNVIDRWRKKNPSK
jgi:hypothetical protein